MQIFIGIILCMASIYLPFLVHKVFPKCFEVPVYDMEWYIVPNLCMLIIVAISLGSIGICLIMGSTFT